MIPEMNADRWTLVRSIFDELVELDRPSQDERLAVLEASDPLLRSAVAELLAADADAERRLARVGTAFARAASIYEGPERDADPDPLKLVGTTISHFRVRELLVAGGMGVVYVAEDTHLHRTVALKFPLSSRRADKLTKTRFLHEARSVGALEHPNVCSIYQAGETDDGHLFFAMPLYDGQTLQERIAANGALTQTDTVAIARQIAAGLDAAHKAGIVHRDVKPANVMLLADGGVKLLDFGLAKVHDVTFTAPESRVGTVSYMSPEQIQGLPIDSRTDVWALGVVLYEMLTGRRPFEGDYDVSIAHAIVHEQPRPLSDVPAVSPWLADAVMRCLEKDSGRRPASATEILRAFDALPAVAREVDSRVPGSRRRNWAIALAAVAVAVVGGRLALRGLPDRAPEFVIVADFATEPADSNIADALTDATRRVLSASRAIRSVPDSRVRAARRRLRIPDAARLSDSLARQVALGDGIRGVVTGSLKRMGQQYLLSLKIRSAVSGDVLASDEQFGVATNMLRHALDTMSQRLRVGMGDDLEVIRSEPSLLALTSSSLDAMLAYAAGLRAPRVKAESLFRRAIALDESFAIALWQLTFFVQDFKHADERRSLLARAYANRNRLTEYERLRVEATYLYSPAGQTPDRARLVERLRQIVDRYPNFDDAVKLGDLYRSRREFAAAESSYRRAIALDSTLTTAHVGAILALLSVERIPAAEKLSDPFVRRFPRLNIYNAYVWYAKGRRDSVRAIAEAGTRGLTVASLNYYTRSTVSLLEGRLADWQRDLHTSDSLDAGRPVSPLPFIQLRANYWVWSRPAEGLRILDSAIAADPTKRDMAAAELYAMFGQREKALAIMRAVDSVAPDRFFHGSGGHMVMGWIRLNEDRPREAIEEFRKSQVMPDGPVMASDTHVDPQLGLAFERAGLPDSAIAAFEHYVNRSPRTGRLEDDALRLAWVVERLAPLYEARARPREAHDAWKRLVDLWQNADEELQPRVAHAKERLAALTR